jgi:trehalose 6-phosphate synthase
MVNERYGVVCLSSSAGSYDQLRHGVITVDPLDVHQTSQALEMALELKPEVRRAMAEMNRATIASHQLGDWLRHLIQDLELIALKKGAQLRL